MAEYRKFRLCKNTLSNNIIVMFFILIFAVFRKICQTQKLRNETNQKISLNNFEKVVAHKLCT